MLALVVGSVEHARVGWREVGHKVGLAGANQNVGAT